MRAQIFPEWRNSNKTRNYPFADNVSLTNREGFTLPRQIFLDARVHMVGGAERQFLSEIRVSSDRVRIIISDVNNLKCYGDYTPGVTDDIIELFDTYNRPAGVLIIDPQSAQLLLGFNVDSVKYDVTMTELCSSCVTPVPHIGVEGIIVDDELLTGDIWLVGGPGVALSLEGEPSVDNDEVLLGDGNDNGADNRPDRLDYTNIIRVDIVGDPYATLRDCLESEGGELNVFRFLKTINAGTVNPAGDTVIGKPDKYGNFVILPGSFDAYDNAVRVEPRKTGIAISIAGVK